MRPDDRQTPGMNPTRETARPRLAGLLIVVGLALLALLAAALATAQTPPGAGPPPAPLTPAERALIAAEADLATGTWQPALAHLVPHAADPRVAGPLFDLGLALLDATADPRLPAETRDALLDGAITAFRALLAANPDGVRVRLELARAFFAKGQDALARRHFRRVLAGDIPPPVAANVERFLAAIEARKRWSAYGGLALAPDTNIGQVSEQRRVPAPANLRRLLESLGIDPDTGGVRNNPPPTSGIGLRLFAGGEYHHPITDRLRLRLGAGVSHTDHKTQRWDSTSLRLHLGPEVVLSPRTRASLLLTAARHWSAGETSYDAPGLRLELGHRLTDRTRLTLDLARRDHRHAPMASRTSNGPRTDLSLGATHQLTPTVTLTGSLSAARARPTAPGGRTRTAGLRLGVTRDFAAGWTVGLAGSLSRTRWDTDRSTTDHTRRRDTTTDVTVSVHKRDVTIAGFAPRLSVGVTRRRSNSAPYDQNVRRRYGDLSFVRQF